MPIYEYKCRGCGEAFEDYRPISATDEDVTCPKCGRKDPERVYSPFLSQNSAGPYRRSAFSGG